MGGQGLGNLETKKIGEEVYRYLFEKVNSEKIFTSFMHVHQKLTSIDEDFNNQMDRMSNSVSISHLFLCLSL